jgi:hypothetical protein
MATRASISSSNWPSLAVLIGLGKFFLKTSLKQAFFI